MHLTVWTLNFCTNLLAEQDEAIHKIFTRQGSTLKFGERAQSSPQGAAKLESRRQLMPEIEYFVPIPLKCIGNKYRMQNLEPQAQALLNAIVKKYAYFQSAEQFKAWWESPPAQSSWEVEDIAGRPKMTTPDGVGYYELLEQHENNILIGYSQGGLVARYLAFLDRYVFQRNCITAVITVASPNFGSPLANPANKDHIAAGILQSLTALGSLHPNAFERLYGQLNNFTFEHLFAALNAARHDSAKAGHAAASLFETGVKWFSGLRDDPNNAFDEVDIRNFREPHSVLRLIKDHPPNGVYTGAIITGNPDLDDILRSALLGNRANTLTGRLVVWLKEQALNFARRNVRLFKIPVGENEKAAGGVYQSQIMVEHLDSEASPTERQLQQNYAGTLSVLKPLADSPKVIPKQAHDFIIPSVNQVLPDDPLLLGHYLNLAASHNSGKSPDFPAGRTNRDAIVQMLRLLAAKLPPSRTSPATPAHV